ncbi:hypothetical protein CC2G_006564 [Coprinopsis cinerea AmutBmut pab1-1]|nr:hypothetical protein CC2G_006564 [Coprinopsis cinerea AmutBmut pab1-1]
MSSKKNFYSREIQEWLQSLKQEPRELGGTVYLTAGRQCLVFFKSVAITATFALRPFLFLPFAIVHTDNHNAYFMARGKGSPLNNFISLRKHTVRMPTLPLFSNVLLLAVP